MKSRAARALVLIAYTAATVAVAAEAGIAWGTFLGAVGTAIGTLGLAYYSYRATRASQALEGTALETLAAAKLQAAAADDAARQAERARIDALAPIIDLQLSPREEWFRLVDDGGNVTRSLRVEAGTGGTIPEVDWGITTSGYTGMKLDFELTNFGKTTAFVEFKPGPFVVSGLGLIRVPPAGTAQILGDHLWSAQDGRPDEPRPLRIEAEIHGPLTESTVDTLTWVGQITMLTAGGPGNVLRITQPSVLHMIGFEVRRAYPAGGGT